MASTAPRGQHEVVVLQSSLPVTEHTWGCDIAAARLPANIAGNTARMTADRTSAGLPAHSAGNRATAPAHAGPCWATGNRPPGARWSGPGPACDSSMFGHASGRRRHQLRHVRQQRQTQSGATTITDPPRQPPPHRRQPPPLPAAPAPPPPAPPPAARPRPCPGPGAVPPRPASGRRARRSRA